MQTYLRDFKLIFILFILSSLISLPVFSQTKNYKNYNDEEIEEVLKDDSVLDELCKTDGLHIVSVDDFEVYDISKEYFWVSVYAPCRDKFIAEILEPEPSLNLVFGNIKFTTKEKNVKYPTWWTEARLEIIKDSVRKDPDNFKYVTFLAKFYTQVPSSVYLSSQKQKKEELNSDDEQVLPGPFYYPVYFKSNSKEIFLKYSENSKFIFYMPDRLTKKDEQPEIIEMTPNGGVPGSMIKVIGKNFGNNLDKIQIEISSFYNQDIIFTSDINPFYLSDTEDGKKHQVIKFSIIDFSKSKSIAERVSYFSTMYKLRVIVNSRPSEYRNLSIVPTSWKIQTILLSILLLFILLGLVSLIMRKINFIPSLLLDRASNTYSLSKFQAFSWTIVIIGCYFNLAISHGLLLRDGLIPKFNESLIMLMSISFGGLISSGAIHSGRSKNDLIHIPPSFSDLFSQGGVIDLPRLQLFAFTLTSIFIYLYTVFTYDSLENLPDVPQSLLALMGVSQGGYIGGKFMGGKMTVAMVSPLVVKKGEKNRTLTLLGNGFQPESKILFDGYDVIKGEFLNQNAISCVLPEFTEPGDKSIVLIPPSGNIGIIENAFTVEESESESESDSEETNKPSKIEKNKTSSRRKEK